MPELKGSKTEANLMTAFAGESQAHTKYQYYASAAKKEGLNQIAAFFEETAGNEKEHAKIWFKLLHDGMPDTRVNLNDAADGENYEWTDMYAGFAKEAKSRSCLKPWAKSKKSTRSAIASCFPTSKMAWSLRVKRCRSGSAPTVATSTSAKRHWKSARCAIIRRRSSPSKPKTIDRYTGHREKRCTTQRFFFWKNIDAFGSSGKAVESTMRDGLRVSERPALWSAHRN